MREGARIVLLAAVGVASRAIAREVACMPGALHMRGGETSSRDPRILLCYMPVDFRGCTAQPRRHRQPAQGHPFRAVRGPQRLLRRAAAEITRAAPGLLEAYPALASVSETRMVGRY
jgi:hypothetical protein